ncbi:HalOD1 output domain-containing protein [Halorussus halophilus]|uniref:HalOD1 output domain-containing protein n=1 Tax=Halorussus halophilus TaxID=2650975 RepID=UPI001300D295|nr:HalOD1 output domain-containing protein [Halorussus halophilus]
MMEDTIALSDLDIELEQDASAGVYHAQYDWTSPEPLSTVVVRLVAAITDTDPLELEPLRDRVDPDALDELFAPTVDGRPRAVGQVTFPLAGHQVVVSGEGEIEIRRKE